MLRALVFPQRVPESSEKTAVTRHKDGGRWLRAVDMVTRSLWRKSLYTWNWAEFRLLLCLVGHNQPDNGETNLIGLGPGGLLLEIIFEIFKTL